MQLIAFALALALAMVAIIDASSTGDISASSSGDSSSGDIPSSSSGDSSSGVYSSSTGPDSNSTNAPRNGNVTTPTSNDGANGTTTPTDAANTTETPAPSNAGNSLPPKPTILSCGLAQPSIQQYAEGPPFCLVINYDGADRNFTVFYPKVDDFTLLIVADSFNKDYLDHIENTSVFVRLEVGSTSSPYRRRNMGNLVVPFFTAIVEVEEGVPQGITWDDGCFACEGGACLDDQTCAIQKNTCGDDKECDLKFYTGWFGTDVNGRYLTSAGKRLSRFKGGSIADVYNSAKTIVVDTAGNI